MDLQWQQASKDHVYIPQDHYIDNGYHIKQQHKINIKLLSKFCC